MIAKTSVLLAVAAGLTLSALPAKAQQEEIIVTARKRQESILKVPVVESVITPQAIEQYAIVSFTDISNRTPGLVIGNSTGIIGSNVAIRGIGTSGTNPIVDQDVLLTIDGMPLTHGLAYTAGTFDLGQIEVLKGPQSLFYGKNSPAGVVSLRTADPTDKPEIIIRAGYEFEAKEKTGEVILSGPVAPTVKVRLAARFNDMKGWMKNLGQGVASLGGLQPTFTNFAPDKNWVVRGTVLFDPSDRYSARMKVTWAQRRMHGGGDLQVSYCPDGTAGVGGRPVMVGEDCKLDNVIRSAWALPAAFNVFGGIPNGGEPFQKQDQGFGTLEQNLKVRDDLTLTSLTSYYTAVVESLFNGSSSNSFVALSAHNYLVNQQFTQELRLTSDFSGPLNFMFGGFYQDQTLRSHPVLRTNTLIGLPASIGSTRHVIPIKSVSVFGQVQYKITPKLEVSGGGRWTYEKREHQEYNFWAANGPIGPVARPDPRIRSSNFSPEFTLTYTPTDDLTVFGSYKQAFKSGSFNAVTFVAPTTRASFDDEKVEGGELGIKSRLFDRRASVNLAGYYTKYSQIQVGASERGPTGAVLSRTINAASAKIYGLELDASYEPEGIEGLTLNAAVNYNHARYGSFTNAPCTGGQTISQGCNQVLNPVTGRFTAQDLSGRPLSRAPSFTGTVGFDYQRPVMNDMNLAVGSNVSFMSKYYTNIVDFNTPGFSQKGFAKLNMNLALKGPNDAWEVAVIGSNITNKYTAGYCFNSNIQGVSFFGGVTNGAATANPIAGDEEATCIVDRGRSVLLRVTLRPLAWVK